MPHRIEEVDAEKAYGVVVIAGLALCFTACSAPNPHPAKVGPVRHGSATGTTATTHAPATPGTATLVVTPGTSVRAGTTISISSSEPEDTGGNHAS